LPIANCPLPIEQQEAKWPFSFTGGTIAFVSSLFNGQWAIVNRGGPGFQPSTKHYSSGCILSPPDNSDTHIIH
jgi:hypothetical protein